MGTKIARKEQKIFGNTGPTGIVGQFGSYKANNTTYSLDPDIIQALGAWGEGINGSCIDTSPPAIQDMNAVFLVISKWLFYIYEQGVPEFQVTLDYYYSSWINAHALDDVGGVKGIFASIIDGHTGNYLTEFNYWQLQIPFQTYYGVTGSDVNIQAYHRYTKVNCTSTTMTVRLPTYSSEMIGNRCILFFNGTTTATYTVTVRDYGSGTVNGASTKVFTFSGSASWDVDKVYGFICDTTGWRTFNRY